MNTLIDDQNLLAFNLEGVGGGRWTDMRSGAENSYEVSDFMIKCWKLTLYFVIVFVSVIFHLTISLLGI